MFSKLPIGGIVGLYIFMSTGFTSRSDPFTAALDIPIIMWGSGVLLCAQLCSDYVLLGDHNRCDTGTIKDIQKNL